MTIHYASMTDLQNRLPFTLNSNSKPSASQSSGIMDQAGDIINGFMGYSADSTNDKFITGARVVQLDLAANYCMDWHYGDRPYLDITEDHEKILNQTKKIHFRIKTL